MNIDGYMYVCMREKKDRKDSEHNFHLFPPYFFDPFALILSFLLNSSPSRGFPQQNNTSWERWLKERCDPVFLLVHRSFFALFWKREKKDGDPIRDIFLFPLYLSLLHLNYIFMSLTLQNRFPFSSINSLSLPFPFYGI